MPADWIKCIRRWKAIEFSTEHFQSDIDAVELIFLSKAWRGTPNGGPHKEHESHYGRNSDPCDGKAFAFHLSAASYDYYQADDTKNYR
ncbi:MAG TPA: hypothetical protein VMY06_09465 [Sedimentisphaerales bacterium]|nr:hypothetical protein [Sedimentisphaerales bacterium]